MLHLTILFASFIAASFAFTIIPQSRALIAPAIARSRCIVQNAKPDLFSGELANYSMPNYFSTLYLLIDCLICAMIDDIFADDEEGGASAAKNNSKQKAGSKKTYLDEKWQLSPTDEKEIADTKPVKSKVKYDPNVKAPKFPTFSVLYKFRREYVDANLDSTLADHNIVCSKYKRLLTSETMRFKNTRGVSMLWVGIAEGEEEAENVQKEINAFMEEDPLIKKDFVERWEIIDFQKNYERKPNELNSKSESA